jgi:lipoate-protein ligase B
LQVELVARRADNRVGDLLLLTEHDPVVTLGRKSPPDDAAGVKVPIVRVERGGESTFHGPGQIVGYPILLLPEDRRDLHRYLRDLEEVVIRAIGDLGVEGRRRSGLTGVWIGDLKVCSVGVAVRRWVTWHGFALNVDMDLEWFRTFQPCGLDPSVMTRLADHVAGPIETLEVADRLVARFADVFGYDDVAEGRAR